MQKNMNKLYVFDMDGTLVDSMPIWKEEGIVTLKEAGVSNYLEVIENFNHMTAFEVAGFVAAHHESPESGAKIIAAWRAKMLTRYLTDIPLKSGAKEYLEKLYKNGDRIVLASGTPKRLSTQVLTRLGIRSYFSELYDEEVLNLPKKDPQFFAQIAKLEGYKPSDVTLLDDAIYAIKAAKEVGYHTIGVYDVISDCYKQELSEVAERYIMSFKELI